MKSLLYALLTNLWSAREDFLYERSRSAWESVKITSLYKPVFSASFWTLSLSLFEKIPSDDDLPPSSKWEVIDRNLKLWKKTNSDEQEKPLSWGKRECLHCTITGRWFISKFQLATPLPELAVQQHSFSDAGTFPFVEKKMTKSKWYAETRLPISVQRTTFDRQRMVFWKFFFPKDQILQLCVDQIINEARMIRVVRSFFYY